MELQAVEATQWSLRHESSLLPGNVWRVYTRVAYCQIEKSRDAAHPCFCVMTGEKSLLAATAARTSTAYSTGPTAAAGGATTTKGTTGTTTTKAAGRSAAAERAARPGTGVRTSAAKTAGRRPGTRPGTRSTRMGGTGAGAMVRPGRMGRAGRTGGKEIEGAVHIVRAIVSAAVTASVSAFHDQQQNNDQNENDEGFQCTVLLTVDNSRNTTGTVRLPDRGRHFHNRLRRKHPPCRSRRSRNSPHR